jgi:hypothetical protein
MDELQVNVTDSVRALSAWRRESQEQLGAVLGLSKVSVAQRYGGRLKWTLADMDKLCKHYGVTFEQLRTGPAGWLGLEQESGLTPPYVYARVA